MSYDLPCAIVVPVFNRRTRIAQAIRAALSQSHPDCIVIAVDDGSDDGTWAEMRALDSDPRLALIRLRHNLGAGPAKNAGLMLSGDRAVTFHDSDDRPHPDKLLRQARVLGQAPPAPDPCLNWQVPGLNACPDKVSAVLSHHELILPDGQSTVIRREISLVDDLFPNIQPQARVPGDWQHINSGLFHPHVFARIGGYADTMEEDREFRNRLILSGHLIRIIEEPLLTKIETAGSLTQSRDTDYLSPARTSARQAVWSGVAEWLQHRRITPKPVSLPPDAIAEVVNAPILALSPALATADTRKALLRWLGERQPA